MKSNLNFLAILLFAILISSCNNRLIGVWNIEKYETTKVEDQKISLTNIGTIEFKKRGQGVKNINYKVLGNEYSDVGEFNWKFQGNLVSLESENTSLAKTWIIVKNSAKYQIWNSTDGTDEVQVLELKKK